MRLITPLAIWVVAQSISTAASPPGRTNLAQERVAITRQIRLSTLRGSVTAGDKRPLAGARVHVSQVNNYSKSLCPEGREIASSHTDDQGAFRVRLPAGHYCVVLSLNGFDEICYADILISPRARNQRALHITMQVAN